jgi:hypothetical protein
MTSRKFATAFDKAIEGRLHSLGERCPNGWACKSCRCCSAWTDEQRNACAASHFTLETVDLDDARAASLAVALETLDLVSDAIKLAGDVYRNAGLAAAFEVVRRIRAQAAEEL